MEIIIEICWVIFSLIFSFIINYVYAKVNKKKCKISSYLIILAVLLIYGFLAMQAGDVTAGEMKF